MWLDVLIRGHEMNGEPPEFIARLRSKYANLIVAKVVPPPKPLVKSKIYPLVDFQWEVSGSGVKFKVVENPMNACLFKYWSMGKIPPIMEWVSVLRAVDVPEEYIKKTIKRFNRNKKKIVKQ